MRQFIAIALLTCVVTASAQNQVTDTSATCVAYWKKGDTKNLIITKTSQKLKEGKQTESGSYTCEATLKVIDSTAEGYTIEWQYRNMGNNIADPLTRSLVAMVSALRIVYTTDENGSFLSLSNYEEVRSVLVKTFDLLMEEHKDKPDMDKLMEPFRNMLNNRESIEHLALREISLYHTPYGMEYLKRGERAEVSLANLFGGEPFPAISHFMLKEVKNDRATIVFNMEMDKVKGMKIMKEVVNKMVAGTGKKIPNDALPDFLTLNDVYSFEEQLSTGWLRKASVKRLVKISDQQKIETTEIVAK